MTPVGRFAPSPTGPLHMGSLFTALASFLSVKQRHGRWLVRIDDLDTPRNVPGSIDAIMSTLAAHGLVPDAPPILQSARLPVYARALAALEAGGNTFACTCSRKSQQGLAIYPGTCRDAGHSRSEAAIRFRVPARSLVADDLIQGAWEVDLRDDIGDFVIFRRDGFFAYHLACAVDDGDGVITEVMRGADLLRDTPAQLLLMDELGLRRPVHIHLPVLNHHDGQKLSKQSRARAVGIDRPQDDLRRCLTWLGIHLPQETADWTVGRLLAYGMEKFCVRRIPRALPAGIAG